MKPEGKSVDLAALNMSHHQFRSALIAMALATLRALQAQSLQHEGTEP